ARAKAEEPTASSNATVDPGASHYGRLFRPWPHTRLLTRGLSLTRCARERLLRQWDRQPPAPSSASSARLVSLHRSLRARAPIRQRPPIPTRPTTLLRVRSTPTPQLRALPNPTLLSPPRALHRHRHLASKGWLQRARRVRSLMLQRALHLTPRYP